MAALTLEQMKERLADYLAAEKAILQGQAYSLSSRNGNRSLTRADLNAVRDEIDKLIEQINAAERGGIRMRQVVPL